MSVYNGAGIVGQELGAALTAAFGVTATDFDNLAPLLLVCSLTSLLPLPFIGVLQEVEAEAANAPPLGDSKGGGN